MRPPKPTPPPAVIDWDAHLDALLRSGLSVPEYARLHGLKPDTLYKRRRARARPSRASRLVPITVEATALCELAFPDGRVLRFPTSLAPDALRAFALAVSPR